MLNVDRSEAQFAGARMEVLSPTSFRTLSRYLGEILGLSHARARGLGRALGRHGRRLRSVPP